MQPQAESVVIVVTRLLYQIRYQDGDTWHMLSGMHKSPIKGGQQPGM